MSIVIFKEEFISFKWQVGFFLLIFVFSLLNQDFVWAAKFIILMLLISVYLRYEKSKIYNECCLIDSNIIMFKASNKSVKNVELNSVKNVEIFKGLGGRYGNSWVKFYFENKDEMKIIFIGGSGAYESFLDFIKTKTNNYKQVLL